MNQPVTAVTATAAVAPTPLFVHVDLDGLWTLAACYGYPEGESFMRDVVFERGLPRLVGLFDRLGIRATFFIIGRDLAVPAKAEAIAALAAAGHELANHTWSHRLDLEELSPAELTTEIERVNDALFELTGTRPAGLRAPGYGAGERVLQACVRAGLRYEGSSLPTAWGPALRWAAGRLRARVRRELGAATCPVPSASRQYGASGGTVKRLTHWTPPGGGASLVRLPLAVSGVLRLPLHASLGMMMGEAKVLRGLHALLGRGEPVTWLVHGMDALGAEDLAGQLPKALAGAKPFGLTAARKLQFLETVLSDLTRHARVMRTVDWMEEA